MLRHARHKRNLLAAPLLVRGAAAAAPAEKAALREHLRNQLAGETKERVDLVSAIGELTMTTEWMSAYQEHLASALEPLLMDAVTAGRPGPRPAVQQDLIGSARPRKHRQRRVRRPEIQTAGTRPTLLHKQ